MSRRLITVNLRPVDARCLPADGEWFAQDVVIDIKRGLFPPHGDSSLVFDSISIAPEILVFRLALTASIKLVENKEEGEAVGEILGQVEAGSRDWSYRLIWRTPSAMLHENGSTLFREGSYQLQSK